MPDLNCDLQRRDQGGRHTVLPAVSAESSSDSGRVPVKSAWGYWVAKRCDSSVYVRHDDRGVITRGIEPVTMGGVCGLPAANGVDTRLVDRDRVNAELQQLAAQEASQQWYVLKERT